MEVSLSLSLWAYSSIASEIDALAAAARCASTSLPPASLLFDLAISSATCRVRVRGANPMYLYIYIYIHIYIYIYIYI